MQIGIIGSSVVGQTLATKLLEVGNEVMISSRHPLENKETMGGKLPSPVEWAKIQSEKGHKASAGSFEATAQFGELIFNCTAGMHSLEALNSAGGDNLIGKILIDVANPLDFSNGMPPSLSVCNTDSLGEQIQKAFPKVKVVKTLNTVSALVMVNPSLVPGESDIFIAGNDEETKKWVKEKVLQKWFGWKSVVDLGDITGARATEMYLPLWLRLWGNVQTPNFNIKIIS